MAVKEKVEEKVATEVNKEPQVGGGAPPSQDAGAQQAQRQPVRLTLDDRGVSAQSSDFWLISSTPEEVIISFSNHKGQGTAPIKISHKIVMNYYNAKRLLAALNQTIKGYEQALESMNIEPK